ncbi:MAG: hypothetical protein AUI14_15105 [Actinobacteria bacterium 13_2_20CM_2_71_6]|nr:MAG: hypothetical protein AUI14_15105 [Actinobacteria bacterium 13_2_20CM_2_71_6]
MQTTVTHIAADKRHGMTLIELEQFIAEARRVGVEDGARISVYTNWRGGGTTLMVTSAATTDLDD